MGGHMLNRKIRLGVLLGGRSAEHEVSLMSARSVLAALDPDRYEVTLIGIAKNGQWLAGPHALEMLEAGQLSAPDVQPALLPGVPGTRQLLAQANTATPLATLDVVFPILHGPFGEDGTVQGLLELATVPYVGGGVLASALAMDKAACKDVLRAHGLPVVDGLTFTRADLNRDFEAVLAACEARWPYPLFVKPANLGSSVGVTKARTRAELAAGLRQAARHDRRLLVERGVNAREIEVSVLGNDDPQASVAGEIVPNREFYDYQAKYLDNASQLLIPAPIPPAIQALAQEYAVRAFRAIDGAGLARVDFLLDRDTGDLFLNEINTLPGFTAISMYPKLWQASGLPYTELLNRLIDLALERHTHEAVP